MPLRIGTCGSLATDAHPHSSIHKELTFSVPNFQELNDWVTKVITADGLGALTEISAFIEVGCPASNMHLPDEERAHKGTPMPSSHSL